MEIPEPSSPLQPQQEQPNPKRQKMSTTTTSDDDEQDHENTLSLPRKPRYKRRKVAIFFAYCGVGYQGMQKNPGAKTIEGDLEEALFFSGAVPEEDRGQPKRFDWARSARTDKGVSAVGQVVSGRFFVDLPGFVDRLNSNLSPQIRIFGYKRATPSFNAKKFCDRRRYVYLIPVFALDPSCHRDRESVLASLGSGEELVKCFECSERGRKVFGVMGKQRFDSKIEAEAISSGIPLNSETDLLEVETNGNTNTDSVSNSGTGAEKIGVVKKIEEDKPVDSADSNISSKIAEVIVENKVLIDSSESRNKSEADNENGEPGMVLENRVVKNEITEDAVIKLENANGDAILGNNKFCYGEQEKERFNRVLKYYVGTHNFHNFTTRTKAEDPAAKRYILSFNANNVVNIDGINFIKCEVVGQSFMLHQIRKMIGLAVAIMRNYAPESLIETAFQQKVNITVPMAPEVGLYLDECFFSSYNNKWKHSHEELSMTDYAVEAEDFKMKHIYPHIASTEHKDGVVALWLHSLNYRNYPDLHAADIIHNSDLNADEVADNVQNSASSKVNREEIATLVE